jgi:hypothetical protein
MNQELTIVVHATSNDEDLDVIIPNVNGLNMPIVRGVPTKVKRKYVAALARSRITTYKTEQMNPMQPDSIAVVPRSAPTYPFTVEKDPAGQRGIQWLRQIIAQR